MARENPWGYTRLREVMAHYHRERFHQGLGGQLVEKQSGLKNGLVTGSPVGKAVANAEAAKRELRTIADQLGWVLDSAVC
jgi:hypothetical protein